MTSPAPAANTVQPTPAPQHITNGPKHALKPNAAAERAAAAKARDDEAAENAIILTNATNSMRATRFYGTIYLKEGEAAPNIISSDPEMLAVVVGTPGDGCLAWGAYPLDARQATEQEHNGMHARVIVTVGADEMVFLVSGHIAALPPKGMLPEGCVVGPWVGAPLVPLVPA